MYEISMKLYSRPLSPYSARVRGAIYAKDIPVEILEPPANWSSSADIRALNPAGRIPILMLDDGTALPESGIIVEYLDDAFAQRPLKPGDPKERARVRLIAAVADLYVMQAAMPAFLLFDAKDRDEAAIAAQFDKLHAGLQHLDSMLAPGGYAHGERISIADVWLTPVRFTLDGLANFTKRPTLLDRYPAISAYSGVIARDPALSRVWREMTEGLKAFAAIRAKQGLET